MLLTRFNRSVFEVIKILVMSVLCCEICVAQDMDIDKTSSDQHKIIYQPVNIEITTHLGDQQVFVEKDIISFFINLNKASFVYVFYQDVSGAVYQLMPGNAQLDNYFKPGFYIPFPSKESLFQFVVQAPFGKEQLWIFASDKGGLKFYNKGSVQGLNELNLNYIELTRYIKKRSSKVFGKNTLIINTRGK